MIPDGWQQDELGALVSFKSGGTPQKGNPAYWDGDIPWVSAKDLKSLFLDSAQLNVTAEGAKNGARLVPAGTLLILVRGMTLLKDVPVAVATVPLSFNQDIKALVPKDRVDGKYLAYFLVSRKPQLINLVNQAGHGTGRLQTDLLKSFPVLFPPTREEQDKVAKVLHTWGHTIDLTERLIAAKRARRRWLMQQLLTGRRRFPGFTAPWREVPLGEFFEEFSQLNKENRDLVPLSCSKVHGIVPQSVVFDKRVASADIRRYKVVSRGDLVYDPMLLWDASIGFQDSVDTGVISPAYCTFHFKDGSAEKEYFRFLFKSHYMRHQYKVMSQGTNTRRRKAPSAAFLATRVPIPESREEQSSIVDALMTATTEVELLSGRRDALANQKKGLMQQLLTGKVRVKVPEVAA